MAEEKWTTPSQQTLVAKDSICGKLQRSFLADFRFKTYISWHKTLLRWLGGSTRAITYAYDNNGNRTRITHPDSSAAFSYQFDALNRMVSIHEQASTNPAILSVLYNDRSRREALERPNGTATGYEYDSAGRLLSFSQDLAGSADDLTNTFGYNPAGQITAIVYSNGQYRHAGNGNRAGIYIPNGLNQYTQVNDVPIEYDGNGNLVVDGDRTYIYDDENRLIEVTDSSATGAVNATFAYDPLGRLFEVVINGERRQFLYDGDALIAEYTSGTATTPIRRYVHGDQVDEPLMEYHGSSLGASARRYLHANHQGSIIAHTNQNGSAVAKLSYDAYGIPGDGNVGRFAYTGQIWFEELGLYHYKARMYSPTLGRFLQTDPIGYEDQMNLYAYVHNDPMNYIDPTGEASYLVSRPLDAPIPANHNFIVTNAEYLGDPNATVYSYGNTGDGRMGRVDNTTTGFSDGTHETDRSAWQDLSNEGSSITYRELDATDSKVDGLARGLVQGQKYNLVPVLGRGSNSNSAAGAIATAADGGPSEVDNGRAQYGSGQADRVPIMLNFLRD